MNTALFPKSQNQLATPDPHHEAAVVRGQAAIQKLQEQGIIDKNGQRIQKGLPADMRGDKDRDFGG